MNPQLILALLAFTSGSLAGFYIRSRSEKILAARIKCNNHRMSDYRGVVKLMRALLYFDQHKNYWGENWKYYGGPDEVVYELKKEWSELLFYAPPDIVKCVQSFIINPDKDNFNRTLLLMRKDLMRGKTDVTTSDLRI